MFTIPGLSPQAADQERTAAARPLQAPDASRLPSRIAAPQARVVDTYVRPEAPVEQPVDRRGMQLAEALSALNPALQQFFQARQPDPDDSYAEARRDIAMAKDKDDFLARAERGEVASLNNLEGQRALGEAMGYQAMRDVEKRYAEGYDPATGDPDALFQEAVQPYIDKFGKDRAFNEAFMTVVAPGRERLLGAASEDRTKRLQEEQRDTVYAGWTGRVETMAAQGTAPADIATSIFSDFDKNRSYLNLPPKEQQEMVLQIADQQATKGNFDVAESLLTTVRTNGPYTGSLATDRDLGGRASDLLARISAERIKQDNAALAQTAEAQARGDALAAAQQGQALMITNVTVPTESGGTKEIPADARLKQVGLDMRDSIAETAKARGMTPEQAQRFEAQQFYGAGVEHPDWFRVMNGGVMQASINNVTGENLPPALEEGYGLYRKMRVENPMYLGKFIDGKAREFYAAADTAQEMGLAADPATALRLAHQASKAMAEDDPAKSIQYKELDAQVKKVMNSSKPWFGGLFGGMDRATNTSAVRTDVQKTAGLLTRMGLGPEEALKKAGEFYTESHVNVLGSFVRFDKRMPANFPEMAQGYVEDFIDEYGEALDLDIDDVTISDATNGVGGYTITSRATGLPIPVAGFKGDFGFPDMVAVQEKRRTKTIQGVVEEGNK